MQIENLALIVESVAGADPLRFSRSRPNVEARVLLVSALREKGYTQREIGEVLGLPRITIQHYCSIMRDAQMYNNIPGLLPKWARLKNILDL